MQRPTDQEIALFHHALIDYAFSAGQSKDEGSLKWSIRSMLIGAVMLDGNEAQRSAWELYQAMTTKEHESTFKLELIGLLSQRADVEARVLRLLPIELVLHLAMQATKKLR